MMSRTLRELMLNYKNSIEHALAGALTGKKLDDLDDSDIEAARELAQHTSDEDYIALGIALQEPNEDKAKRDVRRVIQQYNPGKFFGKQRESENIDRDLLEAAGFTYFAQVPESIAEKLNKYLDEEEVEYMADGTGSYQLKLADREKAYRVESAIEKMLRKGRVMRDSEQLDEFNPFGHLTGRRHGAKPKGRFDHIDDVKKLQSMADRLSREGAGETAKREIHDRIRELGGEPGIQEGKTKRKEPPKPRNAIAQHAIARSGAGAHEPAKYSKKDRQGGKHRKNYISGDEK